MFAFFITKRVLLRPGFCPHWGINAHNLHIMLMEKNEVRLYTTTFLDLTEEPSVSASITCWVGWSREITNSVGYRCGG